MPFHCVVPNCYGNYDTGPKVSTFAFPSDLDLRKKWIQAIKRDKFTPSKFSRVCELHFEQNVIKRTMEAYDERTGKHLSAPLKVPRLVKVARHPQKPLTRNELIRVAIEEWENLPLQTIDGLIMSMERPIKLVLLREVCELHFSSSHIERITTCFIERTGESASAPLKIPRLIKGAIPTKLPGCPDYESDEPSPQECSQIQQLTLESSPLQDATTQSLTTAITSREHNFSNTDEICIQFNSNTEQGTDCQDLPLESFSFICRTCLMYTKSELFSIKEFGWEDLKLKDVLYVCASLKVDDSDKMPKNMCKGCIQKIYDTHNFLSACKKSDTILKQILNKTPTTESVIENSVSIENEIKLNLEENNIEGNNDVDNFPCIENDPDDSEEIKKESEELSVERNPNKKLINTIQSIRKEIKQIRVKNRSNTSSLQRAHLLSCKPKPIHTNVKRKGPPFTCITCHVSFQDYKDLRTHRLETKHKSAMKYVCSYCNIRRNNYSSFLEHVRTHTGEKPNLCTICGRGFNYRTDLRRHMLVHSVVKPFNCRFCSKGFTRRQYLTEHERKHTGEQLICSFCGKGFYTYCSLLHHERTHKAPSCTDPDGKSKTYNGSFQCQLCDKVLLTKLALNAHILLHGPRNFSCEKCGKTFITEDRLQGHIQFVHQGPKFFCMLCNKAYKQKYMLDNHMKSHTGENIYQCEICNKRFFCKGSLNQHQRIHTGDTKYQCKQCLRICLNKRNLDGHLRTHTGEKPFSCKGCSKAFANISNLKTHMKIHTGEKKHLCSLCGKGFYYGRSLRKHMSVHIKTEKSCSD